MAEHGTRTRYVYGCRCDLCRSANAAAQREYMQRRRDRAAGTLGRFPMDCSDAIDEIALILGSE